MENTNNEYIDFVVTARKYKTTLTNKYKNRPVWKHRQPGDIYSALPGTIIQIAVTEGQAVREGELLLILEAMKMLNRIVIPVTGIVQEITVKKGDKIGKDVLLARITEKGY